MAGLPLAEITECQRLTLRPGDALLVKVDGALDKETARRIQATVREALGAGFIDIPVLVADAGITCTVLHQSGEEEGPS